MFSLDLMRACPATIAYIVGVVATWQCDAQSPPPLLARPPRAVYLRPNKSGIPVTDLCQAILENDARGVEALLQRGADPNDQSPPGLFPLIQAMDYQTDQRIAELLIKYGANVNVRTPKNEYGQTNGWTPIFYAIYKKRADLLSVLLKHHAKVQLRDTRGKSPLDWAKQMKQTAMVKQIEAAGATDQ